MRDPVEHQEYVDRKRAARMAKVDALPPEMREVVHEYGLYIVEQFRLHGITKPRVIRHLVNAVLDEFSPTRGSYAQQGIRTPVETHPAAAQIDKGR